MLETFEKYRDDLSRAEAWRSDRVSCIPHYHTGVEIVYVLEGRVSAIIGGRALTADAGQAIVSGSYTVHAYGEEKAPAIVAIIPPCETPALQKRLIAGRFVNPVFSDEDDRLKQMMQLLLSEQEDAVVRAGLSAAVLGFAMRKAGFETMAGDDKGGLMAQVLRYLSENYAQPLSVEHMAAHFGYSRSRFSHLFKANIGVSVPRYINILRCRDAAEALLNTDLPVVDSAINAGFNNTHTFYTSFRELYHMTPGEYVKTGRS